MEVSILNKEKGKLKLGIKGETHTFCNLIRKELWNDKDIKVSGYNLEHSLTGYPVLIIETDEKHDPRKSLIKSIERLKKQNKELREQFKKVLQ